MLGAIAAGFVGYTLWRLTQAIQDTDHKGSEVRRVGGLGLAARGIVFMIIGVFLIVAALTAHPNQARGLSGALRALEQPPFGPWTLGVVALGLMAYGLYMLLLTRYRRIVL